MVNYKLISDENKWNDKIIKYSNYSPYQCYEWGNYKKKMGWKVASIEANNNGNISYFQITYKKKFNIFIAWGIGSISGDIGNFNKSDFIEFIKKHFGVKYLFIKINFTNKLVFNESLSLYNAGWNKSSKKINSDYSILVDLNSSLEEIVQNCSSNWRKNLKRGQGKNHDIQIAKLKDLDSKEIDDLFNRFRDIKDIPLPNLDEICKIKEELGDKIYVAISYIESKAVGLRAFLYHEYKSLDFWAVTDQVGRKNYTSFVLLFELLKKAKELKINEYDMSGVDPLNNPNVYSFKNGLRAELIEKLGEWDLTNSKLLTVLVNRVVL